MVNIMKHPEKWRETIDPGKLPFHHFVLTEVIGYPHAGNDVFQVKGIYREKEVLAYIKAARQAGADIENEVRTIQALRCPLTPEILDYDGKEWRFVVTLAREGERLSAIVGDNADRVSLDYLYRYGQMLARLHSARGNFSQMKDRRFFHVPDEKHLRDSGLAFVYEFLVSHRPEMVNRCFCHGDFHYANLLWKDKEMSAILDFELAGMGNREFDIAWAFALRQGQRFLNTREEVKLFLEGYLSVGTCCLEYVGYYLVLIYSYFYGFRGNPPEYTEYMMGVFEEVCR